MIEIKRHSNDYKFKKALEKVSFRFPVAEISAKTGYGKSQVSKILKGNVAVSDDFLEKFIESFSIVLSDSDLGLNVMVETKKNQLKNQIKDPLTDALIDKITGSIKFTDWLENFIKEKAPNVEEEELLDKTVNLLKKYLTENKKKKV